MERFFLRHLAGEIDDLLEKARTAIQEHQDISHLAKNSDVQQHLNNKVDKVDGKALSTNDYTNEEKAQVERVRNGSVVVDNTLSALDETSNKPVSGEAVSKALAGKVDKVKEEKVDNVTFIKGMFVVYSDGVVETSSVNSATDYFNIDGCTSIRILSNTASKRVDTGIAFYTSEKVYISGVQDINTGIDGVAEKIIDIPMGAVFARATIRQAHQDEWYCYKQTGGMQDIKMPFSGKGFIGTFDTSETLRGRLVSPSNGAKTRISNFIELGDASFLHLKYEGIDEEFQFRNAVWYDDSFRGITYEPINSRDKIFPRYADAKYLRITYSITEDAFAEDFPISIYARYLNYPPCELPYEVAVPSGTYPNRVMSWFSFIRPKNAALNVKSENENTPILFSDEPRFNGCSVFLPPTYSVSGAPVRMIMYMSGSGNVSNYNPVEWNKTFIDYFNAQGYAVAFCPTPWGMASDFAYRHDEGGEFWGTPTNYAVYEAFYKHLLERYNIKNEVFMYGKSQGGYQLSSLPYVVGIPTLAICALSCAFFGLVNMWGYDDKERIAAMRDFSFDGMEFDDEGNLVGGANVMLFQQAGVPNFGKNTDYTEDRKAFILSQADKIKGLLVGSINNVTLTAEDFIEKYRSASISEWSEMNPKMVTNIPHLLYVAKDDASIYQENAQYHTMINNANGFCRLRLMPSGLDNPHNAATSLAPTIVAKTKYKEEMTVPITCVEMFEFFKRYER